MAARHSITWGPDPRPPGRLHWASIVATTPGPQADDPRDGESRDDEHDHDSSNAEKSNGGGTGAPGGFEDQAEDLGGEQDGGPHDESLGKTVDEAH